MGKMEREHVYFPLFVERAQLHPRDHANAHALRGLTRRADTVNSVVIRKRERRQPASRRGLDYSLGRENAVRGGRVRMQVDESRPARLVVHRS